MAGTASKETVAKGRARCIAISTEASLREMVYPSALVMLAPLLAGKLLHISDEEREEDSVLSCLNFFSLVVFLLVAYTE